VLADETRVTQILLNLVDNAYNYTPPGGQITIRAQALEGAVEIGVTDTGIGIPTEELPHIFERFYRANHPFVQRIPGTGLGLAIVKHLVELHGGHVWVDSEPGRGSTFRFLLPTP
jgi:two-component system phosphate regulon sensor histidine kinase PhoR